MLAVKKKSTLIRRMPRLQSGSYVHVSPAGRLEVDGRKLFGSKKIKEAIAAFGQQRLTAQ